jgi:predicted 3-demethylubiquinone-9 3-methyltransferase (glyoxalase superfamily)
MNDKTEEAAKFYTSIFKNSKIRNTTYYGETGAKASGICPHLFGGYALKCKRCARKEC